MCGRKQPDWSSLLEQDSENAGQASPLASPVGSAKVRFARPTSSLDRCQHFYCDGVGLDVLGKFVDHDGFDGLIVGLDGAGWHLEFLHIHGQPAPIAPSKENQIVFYLPDPVSYSGAVDRMRSLGYSAVEPANPYWKNCSETFADHEGYRVVFANKAWPPN